jgi:sec-independent protein translocase protein TatC
LLGGTGGTVAVILRRRRQKNPDGSMTLVEHLDELRTRLIISVASIGVGFAIAWPLYRPVFNLLTNPYCSFMKDHPQLALHPENPCALVYLSVVEPFLVKLKTVGVLALVIALPVVLYQLWRFVTPALKSNERRYAIPFVVSSIALFALGGYFAMLTLPKGLGFLLGFAGTERVATILSVGKYVGFVTLLILAFGASFEFPLLLISLTMVGVLSSRKLRAWRRYAVVVIAIVAAVITPSQDWFTMTALMVPLLVFYELSILVARLRKK